MRPGGLALTVEALELCDFAPGARVLDLACGSGATLKLLKKHGFEALGLDASPTLTALAREQGPAIEADFHHLPLTDQSLDGIFCECALSLADRPEEVLAECARTLKPGGLLVLSDIILTGPTSGGGTSGPATLPQMCDRLTRAGFTVKINRDHNPALRELAARLVWRFGSAEVLSGLWCGRAPASGGKYGYTLIIAERR